MTAVVPTANVFSKNASSPQSHPKRKPLYQPTRPTHIFAILGLCLPNVAAGRYILSKGRLLYMGLTDNLWAPWQTLIIRRRMATLCRLQGHIKAAQSTMIEVTHSLPMLKIK